MAKPKDKEHGRYSKVSRRMWNDAKVRALSWPPPNGFTLFQRLLTGPELGVIPGVIAAWDAGLARALRWDLEGFRHAFAEVINQGLAQADWEAGLVWVPKAIEHNKPVAPNVVKSWRDSWEEVPECALKLEAYNGLKAFLEGMHENFAKAFVEACRKPLPLPCRIQEQEQDQDQEIPPLPPHAANDPKPKRSRRKPQTPLPSGFAPLERQAAFARKHGLDLASQVTRFASNAEAKDLRYADWHRALDTWLANSASWGNGSSPRGGGPRPVQTDTTRTGFENAEIEHV